MEWNYTLGTNLTYAEAAAGFVPRFQDFYACPESYRVAPFRIFGNLYYVGDQKVCSHLIDTGDGLILFDTGYGNTTHMLLDSIRELGFDPMDLRIIIHSHGHFDHFGSGNELRAMTGATVYMSAVDTALLRERPERGLVAWGPKPNDPICWPDVEIRDGDHIRLGSTDIRCVLTPGHTVGTMSFFFDVTDGAQTLRAGYLGGAGFISIYREHNRRFGLPLDKCRLLKDSLAMLKQESVDIHLGNHPSQNHTLEKRQWMLAHPDSNPFVNPRDWPKFLDALDAARQDFEAKGY